LTHFIFFEQCALFNALYFRNKRAEHGQKRNNLTSFSWRRNEVEYTLVCECWAADCTGRYCYKINVCKSHLLQNRLNVVQLVNAWSHLANDEWRGAVQRDYGTTRSTPSGRKLVKPPA